MRKKTFFLLIAFLGACTKSAVRKYPRGYSLYPSKEKASSSYTKKEEDPFFKQVSKSKKEKASSSKESPPVGVYREEGYASWYGEEFHGRPTASGELFDMYKFTAAHRSLPFGTLVLVKNKKNGKKVVVRINDRGPFVEGRIIDLSYAAAKSLGFAHRGVIPVEIEVLQMGKEKRKTLSTKDTLKPEGYFIQVGAFSYRRNAQRLKKHLQEEWDLPIFSFKEGDLYIVGVGDFPTREEAENWKEKLKEAGFFDAFIRNREEANL